MTYIIVPAIVTLLFVFFFRGDSSILPWRASYYSNPSLRGKPFHVQYEKSPSHDWYTNAPIEGIPPDFFSVRWETRLVVLLPTELVFKVKADDGTILSLNGEEVLTTTPNQINHYSEFRRVLSPGGYDLVLEYFEIALSANIDFLIESKEPDSFYLEAPK